MNALFLSLLITASLLITSPGNAAPPDNWSPLLEEATLSSMLDEDIRVIHVTGNFDDGHIPGAIHAPYPIFRGPQDNPGQLPPLEELTNTLQAVGITADTPVVVVHQGTSAADMGAATRVYWTLKSSGVHEVAILNGGFTAWRDAGLPVSMETVIPVPSDFEPQWQDTWRTDAEEIYQLLDSDTTQLIDARPNTFYLGEQASATRAGTIPGATNLSFEPFFDGSYMLDKSQLDSVLSAAIIEDEPAIIFCNTGHLSSINWFVMSELIGMKDVRLYAESITEWAVKGLPMENEP